MAINFAAVTFEQAQQYFAPVKKYQEKCVEAKEFIAGNDWRDGKNWTGPQFDGSTDLSAELKKAIGRSYTAVGTIRSATRRHRRGVIGRVPTWIISQRNAPADPDAAIPAEIQTLIGEAQIIFNEFWKNSRLHRTLKQFVDDYLAQNRGLLRLFFVQNNDGENVVDIPENPATAVRLIHLFREKPEQGIVVFDKETLQRSSFFRYEIGGGVFIEQCYVENGETVFRTLRGNTALEKKAEAVVAPYLDETTGERTDEIRLPLNGKLLIFEIEGVNETPFVSQAMCSQQKLQNKAATMMSYGLDTDGFRSTILANALPPGEWQEKDGKKVYVQFEKGFKFGAGEVNFVSGIPTVEKNAEKGTTKTGALNPTISRAEPVGVTTHSDAIRESSKAILEDADQKHIAVSVDLELSGESLKQARADYAGSLEDTKSDLDEVMSEVFEAVLSLVAYLMNAPGRYNDLQVMFSAILNPGPVSIEERAQATAEADGGYRTKESAMELIGVVDPDAMAAAVKKQQDENPPEPNDDPKKQEVKE